MHLIVPAGGAGTRLWPLSRKAQPKYLLRLDGHQSLLEATIGRVRQLAESVTVVTAPAQAQPIRDLLGKSFPGLVQVLVEPAPKNSMPAIGWAAAVIEAKYGPDAIVGSFAADHMIADTVTFRQAVTAAVAAAGADYIATIGITPTHAATGYGYIQAGAPIPGISGVFGTAAAAGEDAPAPSAAPAPDTAAPAARPVPILAATSFTEKPDAARARRWVQGGHHYWNAGMFVAKAGVLLDQLAYGHPNLAASLRQLAAQGEGGDARESLWQRLEAIAIDYAVAEPAAARGRVAVVPAGAIGWCDVGDYRALRGYAQPASAPAGGATLGTGVTLIQDSPDSFVIADTACADIPIVVAGIPNALVVNTPQALLVTTMEHSGHVAALRAQLQDLSIGEAGAD